MDGRSGEIRVRDIFDKDRILINGESGEIRVHNNAGDVRIHGDSEGGGDEKLFNSNLAVEFDIDESEEPRVGMVMVLSEDEEGNVKLKPCTFRNDTKIAGVIMDKPQGIVLNHRTGGRKPIAVAGTVDCLVDADQDPPILFGDMLATSDRLGYARKARSNEPGTILGKALRALASGRATIPILLTLS